MRKFFKKIICVAAAAVLSVGLFATAACSDVYEGKSLSGDYHKGEVASNGGFAVEKGDYVYFINGKQSNTADNTFGEVVQGAIMRIAKTDLSARDYNKAEIVVPEIVHSGNTNGGIFIYGDYIYYSTPSSNKNSDGEIQNSDIVFKRAKLDGSEVMKGGFATYTDNSIEYRYVLGDDNKVYLLYVATNENLYGTSCTNLHSVNTETGEDKLIAYNVKSVIFDKNDVTNQRVYYTMSVTDFKYNNSLSSYNQVYTVTADAKEPNEYDFSDVKDYDAEKDPLYINYGKLVLDGVGMKDNALSITQFNAPELIDGTATINREPYTYTLTSYENGTLFYTRVGSNNTTVYLFAVGEETLLASDHKPATGNPENYILSDASSVSDYTYIFENDKLSGAFIASDNGLIKTKLSGGKLVTEVDNSNAYYLTRGGKPTILFTQNDYIYYSETGSSASGYVVKRINYNGEYNQYNQMPDTEDVTEFTPVRILDLDSSSDWYMPEMFEGQILFSSLTKTMTEYRSDTTSYSHIMVCDISKGNSVLSNVEIDELNDKYDSISEQIDEVDETVYENLKNAYRYAFYTGDGDYINTIINAYVDVQGKDEEEFYTKATVEKFKDFVAAEGEWKDFASEVKVNGVKVNANQRDYYYSLLGKMTDSDKEAYDDYIKDTYLQPWPEEEPGWFESLSKGAKAGFLVGVIGGGLLIIAAAVVVTIIVLRKRKAKMPVYTKKRIKVDTTDDKSVDVYADENEQTDNE